MKMPDDFKEQVYDACLKAAKELGADIKKMSWFPSSWKKNGPPKLK